MLKENDIPTEGFNRNNWHRAIPPRERQVWALIASGLDNYEIADRMGIDVKSVENYIHSLFAALQLRGRTAGKRVKATLMYLTEVLGLDLL